MESSPCAKLSFDEHLKAELCALSVLEVYFFRSKSEILVPRLRQP